MSKFDKKALMIPMVVITTVIVVVMLIRSTKAFEVLLDNEPIGIVDDQSSFSDIVEDIRKKAESLYGTEMLVASKIDYKEVYLPDNRTIDTSSRSSVSRLGNQVQLEARVYAINVDGKDIAYLRDKASAEQVLEKIRAPYEQNAGFGVAVDFAEDVSIEEKVAPNYKILDIQDTETVYNRIMQENETTKKYVVQKGDTVSEIAERFGIRVKDIERANPGLNVDRISIGQELNMAVPRYVINVRQSRLTVYEDAAPYRVEYEETDELYKGDFKVKVEGEEGTKLVRAYLISINGVLDETRVVDEVILTQPKPALMLKGTKPRPRTLAYGVFYWPSSGRLTSRFGPRWGERHSGIDIAASKGSPIKAADGGKVKFTGTSGNYGKLVIIDHENGYTTYYGHMNTIKVKTGQRVARGDVIGTVGETGRTTGPHLHFEVRKNGVAVNPLNFLK